MLKAVKPKVYKL